MNEFERECEVPAASDTMQENVIEWIKGSKTATVNLCNNKYASKLKRLSEQYPEDVQIINDAEGVLLAHIPLSYIKISAPRTRNMTDEQKAQIAERARKYLRRDK